MKRLHTTTAPGDDHVGGGFSPTSFSPARAVVWVETQVHLRRKRRLMEENKVEGNRSESVTL
ncbi:hypothetical protein BREVUG8_60120 [Brevundimonas sp. G8]|nr:hypothetical protein BREVUG8_60120 [Brevundimonas sp. G8]